jgi:hypothetical protein
MSEPLNQIEVGMIQTTVTHYARCMKGVLPKEVHQQFEQLAKKILEMECDLTVISSAAYLGQRGGQVKSKAKAKAVRENGKLGGRPANTLFCWECAPTHQDPDNARLIDVSGNRYYQHKSCSCCNEPAHYRLDQ